MSDEPIRAALASLQEAIDAVSRGVADSLRYDSEARDAIAAYIDRLQIAANVVRDGVRGKGEA